MKLQLEHNDGLTVRDKKLIVFILTLVLVVGVGLLAVKPLWSTGDALSAEAQAAQTEKDEREVKLSELPQLRQLNKSLTDSCSDAAADFYPIMDSQDVDRMLTGLALERGFSALGLTITMPTDMQNLSVYPYSADYDDTAPTQDTASRVYTIKTQFALSGPAAALQTLIDDIYASYPALRITDYTWSDQTVVGSTPDAADRILVLNMELYMAEDGTAVVG